MSVPNSVFRAEGRAVLPRLRAPAGAAMAVILTAGVARGQEASAADQALATTLFLEGRRLLEAGSVAEACEKFAESKRLVPAGGTLLNLAACHEKQGLTATAWTEFNAGLAQARRDGREDRVRVASERIAALEERLSTLTIAVDPKGRDGELLVMLDHTPVRAPAWGIPVPVDPGEHVVEASAPHKKGWEIRLVVGGNREARTVNVPALADAEAPASSGAGTPLSVAPVASASTEPAPPPRDRADAASAPSRSSTVRDAIMIGSGVVGLAGIALGSAYGLRAISKHADSDAACPNGRCTKVGAGLSDEAQSAATMSTVGFAVGAAGIGAAAVLFFTRPSSRGTPAVAITPHGGFVGWSGAF